MGHLRRARTFLRCGTWEGLQTRECHGPGVLVVPKWDGCNGLTQTDRNVCRWLDDHRPGDPVRGRAGEGEQVIR